MCIFALARTTLRSAALRTDSCELLQNVYLCISTYNFEGDKVKFHSVVNCFKMCIFALARTTALRGTPADVSCELLQNVYLCISTYNLNEKLENPLPVVNCFKMCIFALARTTVVLSLNTTFCCELLQNVYLCISTYNNELYASDLMYVVNCFKMCIFALARTTEVC